jgi:L-lactate dehydrogenase complex protein LldG
MNTGNQNEFIANVRAALGYEITDPRPGSHQFGIEDSGLQGRIIEKIHNRTNDERKKLLNVLIEQGKSINLKVSAQKDTQSVSQAVKELVLEKDPEWGTQKCVAAWNHPLIKRLRLPQILADAAVPVHYTSLTGPDQNPAAKKAGQSEMRRQVIDSYIGVTSADYCVASTATLVMRDRPGRARSVSLLPLIHVAVIELRQVISDLKELYTLLNQDPREKAAGLSNCLTCITGPSKTGDIELVMVHGAHGPRELHLFVITG